MFAEPGRVEAQFLEQMNLVEDLCVVAGARSVYFGAVVTLSRRPNFIAKAFCFARDFSEIPAPDFHPNQPLSIITLSRFI